MGFNERTEELDEKIEQERERRKEEMQSSKDKPRVRINDGLNVFWIVPGVGETTEAVNDMLIHYGPYHRCLRKDPVVDSDEEDGYVMDNNFSNCPRCIKAWEHWEATGCAEGAAKAKFAGDMENHRAVFQAFDFTPFFTRNGQMAESKDEVIDKWLDAYLEIVGETDDEKRKELLDQYEDSMPEDVWEAAAASPSPVETNKKVGKSIRQDHDVKFMELGKEDPFLKPDEHLYQIIRTDEGGTFDGRNGKQKKKEYSTRFTVAAAIEGWSPDLDQLIEIAETRCVDLHNIEPDSDSLQDRAYALEVFDEETLMEYLGECGHTFDYRDEMGEDEEDEEAEEDSLDPEAFGDADVLTTEDQAETEELKKKLKE